MENDSQLKKIGISIVTTAVATGVVFFATQNKSWVAAASVVSFVGTYLLQK